MTPALWLYKQELKNNTFWNGTLNYFLRADLLSGIKKIDQITLLNIFFPKLSLLFAQEIGPLVYSINQKGPPTEPFFQRFHIFRGHFILKNIFEKNIIFNLRRRRFSFFGRRPRTHNENRHLRCLIVTFVTSRIWKTLVTIRNIMGAEISMSCGKSTLVI